MITMERNENTEWYINHVLHYGFDRTDNLPAGEYLDWWAYSHGIDDELVALGFPDDAEAWTETHWERLEEGIVWATDYINKRMEE
tara:strand:- start:247 stop:501 length:255 start_codon:yes stop_codon:yes gene_type:complete